MSTIYNINFKRHFIITYSSLLLHPDLMRKQEMSVDIDDRFVCLFPGLIMVIASMEHTNYYV